MKKDKNTIRREIFTDFISRYKIPGSVAANSLGCHVSGIYLRKCGSYTVSDENIHALKIGYYFHLKDKLDKLYAELLKQGFEIKP